MLAAYAHGANFDDPLPCLTVGEIEPPTVPADWATVSMRAASLNHHDLWSLKGVGLPAQRLPMILGCDAVGLDEAGNDVVVYPIIATNQLGADATMSDDRSILSEKYPGTFAEIVRVPRQNLVPLPSGWSREEAACLPTAWLTAYRMLAVRSGLVAGNTVLVQGVGGGVATACIALARAMGMRVWATTRDESKIDQALGLGAHEVFASNTRLPQRVDAVMETVGAATWSHSVKSLKPGGTIVISGATTGPNPAAELTHIFFKQLSVVGSTMGTLQDLHNLIALCTISGVRPVVQSTYQLQEADRAFAELASGDVFGKIVLTNN